MEHISTTTLIVTLLIMVVISAYFSGSETGMMTLNRYRLRHRAKQGNRQAKRVEKLLRKPDRLISTVLIGNNTVNILASALGTIVGMRLYGDAGVAIATGVLTFVVLVLLKYCQNHRRAVSRKVAYPSSFLLAPLQILMMPLVWLLNTITRLLMRMMGIKTDIVISSSLSKDELRTLVNESRSQISRRNQDMLLSVLDLEKSASTTSWCRETKSSGLISTTTGNQSCVNCRTPRTAALCFTATRWTIPLVCCAYAKPGA